MYNTSLLDRLLRSMTVTRLIFACLVEIGALYLVGWAGFVRAFILLLAVLFVSLLNAVFLILTKFIWLLIPAYVRKLLDNRQYRFHGVLLFSLAFLLAARWLYNSYFVSSGSLKSLGPAAIFVFTLYVFWGLLKQNRKKELLRATAAFLVIMAAITVWESISKSDNISESSPEQFQSWGYLTWTSAKKTINLASVTKHDRSKSFPGLNLYCPRNEAKAYLIDMNGKVLHSWSGNTDPEHTWFHVELEKNGDLLAIVEDELLLRLDWDSRAKWIRKGRFHHDVVVKGDGDVYALDRKGDIIFLHGFPVPALNDQISVVSPSGALKKTIPLLPIFRDEISLHKVKMAYEWLIVPRNLFECVKRALFSGKVIPPEMPNFDLLHFNTIEFIDKDIPGVCKKGDLLMSARDIDRIAIVDPVIGKIVWKWGHGQLERQHHPTLLENGNILVFDNGRDRGRFSRVIELNPLNNKIVWKYQSDPPKKFYTKRQGSSQRLGNGNTLITESERGHVFEITSNGEFVWEFYSPQLQKETKKRATVYRMTRITAEKYPFLSDRLETENPISMSR